VAIEFVLPYHGDEGDFETIDELDSAIRAAIEMLNDARESDLREIAARHHIEHGDPAEGARHCERVIELMLEHVALDDEDTMTMRGFLGRALTEAGSYEAAEEILGQLVVDRERVLGADDRQTLVTRGNLVRAVGRGGRPKEAIVLGEALLADRLRVLGPDDPSTLDTRGHLASLHFQADEKEFAVEMYRELLADRVRLLEPGDPVIPETRSNLAVALASTQRGEEALDLLRLAQLELMEVFGVDHRGVLTQRQSIADHLYRLDRYDESLASAAALIGDCTRVLGAFAKQTFDAHHRFVKCLRALGEEQKAYDHLRGLIPAASEILGWHQIGTIALKAELVDVYIGMGELQLAENLLQSLRYSVAALEPSTPLRTWIEDTTAELAKQDITGTWWDENPYVPGQYDDDEDDENEGEADEPGGEQQGDVDGLPFATNPRHCGGAPDGEPGDMILVTITDIIPPAVLMATVMDDGYLADSVYEEVQRLRDEYELRAQE